MPSVTLTLTPRQYSLLYDISVLEQKSLSLLVRTAIYQAAGKEPPPYRRTWAIRMISPLFDPRPRDKLIKAAVYLDAETRQLVEELARQHGMSRRAFVYKVFWEYIRRLVQEKYADQLGASLREVAP